MQSLIQINKLSKRYKLYPNRSARLIEWINLNHVKRHEDFWALRNLDLEVGKGECVGVIGPNGAGKSTLLKILSGALSPTTGSYSIEGKVLSLLELGTGFNPELTGRQNVLETGGLLGFSREHIHNRIAEIEEFAGIGHFFDQPIKVYSSGMGVRLAFSMFVFMEPDVLIVDEALAVGDIGFQRRCYARLEHMLARGMTCLFVTHDLGAVIRFCHRAVVLQNGQKVFEGAPRQACNVLNKVYFGEAQINEVMDYGDGSAAIEEIWFEDTTGERITSQPAKQALVFCYRVKFNTDVEEPVFGFHMKTLYGVEVATASTDYLGYEFGKFSRGDVLTLRWVLDLNVNPGTYFFGCGCRYASKEQFLSRRVDAAKFPIIDRGVLGGIINPFRDLVFEHQRADGSAMTAPPMTMVPTREIAPEPTVAAVTATRD